MSDGNEASRTPSLSQEEKDAAIDAANEAYTNGRVIKGVDGKPDEPKPYAEIEALWEALWRSCDFSWDGLADAGWDRDTANFAQALKQWRAPADFPGDGEIEGTGETAWKQATLQDYWRWTKTEDGNWREQSDEDLQQAGLLIHVNGRLWHALHRPDVRAFVSLDSDGSETDMRRATEISIGETGDRSGAALAAAMLERLRSAQNYRGEDEDTRCQLSGARADGLDGIWCAYSQSSNPQAETEQTSLHIRADLAKLEGINVSALVFGDQASFRAAAFGAEASFWAATFGAEASFDKATFGAQASFRAAAFGAEASFRAATFGDQARFSAVAFGAQASFDKATFGAEARFWEATFGDQARFWAVAFEGRAAWRGSEFQGTASFVDTDWHTESHYESAFEGARFRDVANFKTKNFSAFAAFENASFERRLLLSDPSGGETPKTMFEQACTAASASIKAACAENTPDGKETWSEKAARHRETKESHYSSLAGGYRTAKKAMEAQGDFDREQRYYRYEVQARLKRPSTTGPEKIAAWFYRHFSDFGASIGRPFLGLAIFIGMFAVAYFSLAVFLGEAKPVAFQADAQGKREIVFGEATEDAWQALEFSLNNAFRPLSALSTQEPREGNTQRLAGKLLFNHGGGWGNLVRLMAILQSLLSFILAFLFGLAVRRKFQIS